LGFFCLYWFGCWSLIWAVLFHLSWVCYFFLACTRLGVNTVIIGGWSSNSGYSLLGALRALAQNISFSWVFIYAELLCCAIRHDLLLLIILLFIYGFCLLIKKLSWLLYFCDLIFLHQVICTVRGCQVNIFLKADFVCRTVVYQGSLNFIIYLYFPILKELIAYVSYCLITTDNR
jgi:hypothetical protein